MILLIVLSSVIPDCLASSTFVHYAYSETELVARPGRKKPKVVKAF